MEQGGTSVLGRWWLRPKELGPALLTDLEDCRHSPGGLLRISGAHIVDGREMPELGVGPLRRR